MRSYKTQNLFQMTFGSQLHDTDTYYMRCPKVNNDATSTPTIVIPYYDEIVGRNENECNDTESVRRFSNQITSKSYDYRFEQRNRSRNSHWSNRFSNEDCDKEIQLTTHFNKDTDQPDGGEHSRSMDSKTIHKVNGGKDNLSKKKGSSKRDDSRDKDNNKKISENNNEDNTNAASSITSTWPKQLHRQLVEAVYEIGITHASPAVIMEHMRLLNTGTVRASNTSVGSVSNDPINPPNDAIVNHSIIPYFGLKDSKGKSTTTENNKIESQDDNSQEADSNSNFADVTSERVKSHLQKYRKNKEKSKEEFLSEYDNWLQRALGADFASSGTEVARELTSRSNDNMAGSSGKLLLGGEFAACLTHTVMMEETAGKTVRSGSDGHTSQNADEIVSDRRGNVAASQSEKRASMNSISRKRILSEITVEDTYSSRHKRMMGARIPFPVLTEDEKKSFLGESINHVASLFHSMTKHLMKLREEKGRQQGVEAERPVSVSPSHNQQTLIPCTDASVADDSLASGSLHTQQQGQESRVHTSHTPIGGQRSDNSSVGSKTTNRAVSIERRTSDSHMFQRNASTVLNNQRSDVHRYRIQQQQNDSESRTGHQRPHEMLETRTEQTWASSRQGVGSYQVQGRYETQLKQRLVDFNWHRYDESGTWNRHPNGQSLVHPASQQQRQVPRQHTPQPQQPILQSTPTPAPSPGQQSETRQTDRHEEGTGALTSIYESFYSDYQPLPPDHENNV